MDEPIKVGDIVDVTIRGVRNVGHPSARLVRIADEHGDVFDMPPQAKVERAADAHWPPRAGDLWRDREGDVWFAVEDSEGEITMVCQIDMCPSRSPSGFMDTLSPLAFVYREDEQDGAS